MSSQVQKKASSSGAGSSSASGRGSGSGSPTAGSGAVAALDDPALDAEETLLERLAALQDMFPDKVKSAAAKTSDMLAWTASSVWSMTGKVAWVVLTSAMVLMVVPIYEADQDALIEHQEAQVRQQHEQLLMGGKGGPSVSQFGPNPGAGLPGMPPSSKK